MQINTPVTEPRNTNEKPAIASAFFPYQQKADHADVHAEFEPVARTETP